ncbi:MAG: hypothetical protein PUD79_08310 [Prevotellaceae bacterium]|nr:hypothetical protein [Prevotellaceae bacterium]
MRHITLPLYYTGLTNKAKVREQEGKIKTYRLNEKQEIQLTITIPASGYTWYVIE